MKIELMVTKYGECFATDLSVGVFIWARACLE